MLTSGGANFFSFQSSMTSPTTATTTYSVAVPNSKTDSASGIYSLAVILSSSMVTSTTAATAATAATATTPDTTLLILPLTTTTTTTTDGTHATIPTTPRAFPTTITTTTTALSTTLLLLLCTDPLKAIYRNPNNANGQWKPTVETLYENFQLGVKQSLDKVRYLDLWIEYVDNHRPLTNCDLTPLSPVLLLLPLSILPQCAAATSSYRNVCSLTRTVSRCSILRIVLASPTRSPAWAFVFHPRMERTPDRTSGSLTVKSTND